MQQAARLCFVISLDFIYSTLFLCACRSSIYLSTLWWAWGLRCENGREKFIYKTQAEKRKSIKPEFELFLDLHKVCVFSILMNAALPSLLWEWVNTRFFGEAQRLIDLKLDFTLVRHIVEIAKLPRFIHCCRTLPCVCINFKHFFPLVDFFSHLVVRFHIRCSRFSFICGHRRRRSRIRYQHFWIMKKLCTFATVCWSVKMK